MFSKRAIMGVIVFAVAALLVMPVYAGIIGINISSFSGDCDSATVVYSSSFSFVRIEILNKTTGAELVAQFEAAPSGSYTANFDPQANGDTIVASVTVEGGDSATYTVSSCSEGSESSGETYTQMCDDGRANTNLCEPIAIYPIETDDGTGITIWDTRRTGSRGQLVYLAAEELANLPENNCILGQSSDGYVTVIVLGGHIVIIAGPDDENKTFIFFFEEFPGSPVTDTMFGELIFDLPACFD
jgi:hypothetical protein